jgi:phosphotransacetylase
MGLRGFTELFDAVHQQRPAVPLVAAGAADETVLKALRKAADWGWVRPLLTGLKTEIVRVAEENGVSLRDFEILDTRETAVAAVGAIRAQRAHSLLKGQLPTPELMRAVLDPQQGLRTSRTICQVVLMEIPRDQRRFLLADTGICIAPTREQKLEILQGALDVAHALGADLPRVAVMAASEKVDERMPETLMAAELAELAVKSNLRCVVRGPLSFDLAYAAEPAEKKRLEGEVLGVADIMLFPNLTAANLVVKAVMYTADCRFGGVLCGAACPVVFMSRADTVETRLHSLALALAIKSRSIQTG